MTEPFAISSNDAALAHGTAKYLADVTPMARCLQQLQALRGKKVPSVKDIERAMSETLKKYILYRVITKPNGTRAKGDWLMLAPMQNDFALLSIELYKGAVYIYSPAIRVTHHCLARIMQRASKTSDLTKTLRFLDKPLVMLLMELTKKGFENQVPDGMAAQLFVREGKVICAAEGGHLHLKTFVNAEQFHGEDKKIIGDRIYGKDHVSVHWGKQTIG